MKAVALVAIILVPIAAFPQFASARDDTAVLSAETLERLDGEVLTRSLERDRSALDRLVANGPTEGACAVVDRRVATPWHYLVAADTPPAPVVVERRCERMVAWYHANRGDLTWDMHAQRWSVGAITYRKPPAKTLWLEQIPRYDETQRSFVLRAEPTDLTWFVGATGGCVSAVVIGLLFAVRRPRRRYFEPGRPRLV